MIFCKELNKSFATKDLMFKAIKGAKQELIAAKKAEIKRSDPFLMKIAHAGAGPIDKSEVIKETLAYGDYIYPVINTINWLDSHKDVHLTGIWDKSAKEQAGKIYYIINHELEIGKVISYPKEVEILVKNMFWTELGKNFPGQTQALIYKAKLTEKSNRDAFEAFKAGEEIQNSVRMMYVRLELAVNSSEEYYKEEKAVWDKYASIVVNQDALADGYFWAVHEAKIYLEGSAVLFGSNEVTPVLTEEPKHIEPLQSTQAGAVLDTQAKETLKNLFNYLNQ